MCPRDQSQASKGLIKYDDALGRRAKVMIGKSQDRLHRHGIFSISRGIRDLAHSGGNGVSTPVLLIDTGATTTG
jgi:hypothetical protein